MEFCKRHKDQPKPCATCSADWEARKEREQRRSERTDQEQRARELKLAAQKGEVIPGRKSKYRGKDRTKPIQVYFTTDGHAALERKRLKRGQSRPDYLLDLVLSAPE